MKKIKDKEGLLRDPFIAKVGAGDGEGMLKITIPKEWAYVEGIQKGDILKFWTRSVFKDKE